MDIPFLGKLIPWTFKKENPDIPLTADVLYGPSPAQNYATIPSAAMYNAPAFSAVRFISESLATLPLVTYRYETTEEATDHPAYRILRDRPNEYQTPFLFWNTAWQRALWTGNAYLWTEQDAADRLANLVLLDNTRVRVAVENGTKVYTYTGDGDYRISPDRIIHLMGFTITGLLGVPLMTYAQGAIDLAMAAEQYGTEFFTKSDTAPGYIQLDNPNANAAQIQQVRDGIAKVRQEKGQQSWLIIPGGKPVKLGYDNQQSQFLELREFQICELARIFRIPPAILYHYAKGGGTYANLESEQRDIVINSLQPWISQWEQEVSRCIFGGAGDFYVEADVSERERADTAGRTEAATGAFAAGIVTRAEARAMLGYPDDGQTAPQTQTPAPKGKQDGSAPTA